MAAQARSLEGKVVAITGAARGIGLATARACAGAGCRVAIGDLDAERAGLAAAEVGSGAVGLALDVTEEGSFAAFLDEVEAVLGPIDVLVNNAGIMHVGPFEEEDDATTRRTVEINLLGVVRGSKLILPRFRAHGRGHLVNVASSAGRFGVAGAASYSATKFAVVGLSESIRAELRGSGIDVSVVMPGIVDTELAAGLEQPRSLKWLAPDEVAQAIVDALHSGTFDVWVPSSLAGLYRTLTVLPRRAAEGVGRALKLDKVIWNADRSRRQGYEQRAARSGDSPGGDATRATAPAAALPESPGEPDASSAPAPAGAGPLGG